MSGGLDNNQLVWLVRQDARLRRQFLGVFTADRLPALPEIQPRRPCGLIVNSDPANRPGTHWLAIYYGADGQDEFFDSYGESPSTYNRSWPEHMNPGYRYSTKKLQGDDTSVCGHYCVFYLKQKVAGRSLTSIVDYFPGPKRVNDRKICHWVCRSPELLKRRKAQQYCQTSVCGREGTRRRLQCCEE